MFTVETQTHTQTPTHIPHCIFVFVLIKKIKRKKKIYFKDETEHFALHYL